MARIRTIKPELVWSDEETENGAMPFWLYCIVEEGSEDTGPCKIGVATDIKKRLSSLQGGNWRTLNLAWIVRLGDRERALNVENWCLAAFRPSVYVRDDKVRLNSEWIQASPGQALEKALWVFEKRGEPVRKLG